MDIQNKVKAVMGNILGKLGAEFITIESRKISAIPAEVDVDRELMGGSREEREIDYQFPTIKDLKLKKGMKVKANGKGWKISNFQRGKAMTTETLIEPNRVEE
jgi:hypothetical protein